MNVTRHEKVNRIAEAGQNLCGNAFFSNAERIVSALESDSCRELNISFSVTVKASNKDELGIGKIEFENPSLVITNNHKYKDSFDDVVLDFVEPELPGINQDEGKKKEKNVKGVVIDASRQLTTTEARQELVYTDEKTGKTYFAGQGLGDDAFMTFKGLPTDGSRHRYVNKALPVRTILQDAEDDLIAYATKKGWKRVESNENQEEANDLDKMQVKRTIKKIDQPPCGDMDKEGCCLCQEEICAQRHQIFGDAAGCCFSEACSGNCPKLIKEENEELALESEAQDYHFRGDDPDLRCCDNAYKLFKLGYIALMLELDYKKISAWDNDAKCFRVKDEFKTQAAAKREFEQLARQPNHADIAKFNTWKIGDAAKRFRGYEYDLVIRYQTEGGGWGSPEKFNTEAQYKNRLNELREKLDHFEV